MRSPVFAIALTCLISPPAFAVPEGELAQRANEIRAHYDSGKDDFFEGKGGVKLHYHVNEVENAKGSIVLVQGRGERTEKYAELIQDLNSKGYTVFTYDHRGQGASGGGLPEDPHRGHVEHAQDYVDDMKLFVDNVVKKTPQPNLHILAHSMGGLVSSLYLQANPGSVKSAALVSPAFGLNTGHYDITVRAATCMVGKAAAYAKGKGPYDKELPFEGNKYTNSPERFAFARSSPGNPTGGPTNGWVCETLKAGQRAKAAAPRLTTPLFIARADNDLDARIEDQEIFCKRAKNCSSELYRGKHELLGERDSVRDPLLGRVLSHFENTAAIGDGLKQIQQGFSALSNEPSRAPSAVSGFQAPKREGRSPAFIAPTPAPTDVKTGAPAQ